MAYQVCRLCFGKGINLTALNTGENSLGEKLSACVPEINIFIINNPLICATCTYQLATAYKFREKCLLTEKKINKCVKSLYLKSIGYLQNESEVSILQLEECCTSPDSLNTYLNMSILEGLAEATNKTDELEVTKEKIEKPKTQQIQPCYIKLIDCFKDNSIIDEKVKNMYTEKNTLDGCNELKIKEMQSNKCYVQQNILECLDSKNMLNCKASKSVYQKQIKKGTANAKQMYLNKLRDEKARQIKLHEKETGIAESKQTNKIQSYKQKKATEQKLKEQSNHNAVTNKINKPVTGIESQNIDPSKTQYQNGGNPTKIDNSCKDEPKNILKKKNPKTVAFKKYISYKREKTAVNTKHINNLILNNVYAKVYKNRRTRLSHSVCEVKTKNVDFQSQREIASRKEIPKDSSFENEIVNTNERLEKSVSAEIENVEHKKPEDFKTSVNCRKNQFYVNNMCHLCNIVINNVEMWKKHIRDHILI